MSLLLLLSLLAGPPDISAANDWTADPATLLRTARRRAAAQSDENGRPADGDATGKPYLALQLSIAPFRQAAPEETRKRVLEFLSPLMHSSLIHYQDNDEVLAVTVTLKPQPHARLLASIEGNLDRMRFEKDLRALQIGEVLSRQKNEWMIILKPGAYPEAVRSRLRPLGANWTWEMTYYQNKAMAGSVWLDYSLDGLADPQAAARELRAAHPDVVRDASIVKKVLVFDARIGR